MTWRVVDIGSPDLRLTCRDKSLCVFDKEGERDRIPLEDLASVVVHAEQAVLTRHLLAALASAGVPLVLCDSRHHPCAFSLPYEGHHRMTERVALQMALSAPRRKMLWKSIVRQKLLSQRLVLSLCAPRQAERLRTLALSVRSGDRENREAQGAALYWPALLGENFRRDIKRPGLNSHLNYGYAILRACVARSVVGVGLLPCFGLHHRSVLNAFQLVDDLMEPYRPFVDRLVFVHRQAWEQEVTSAAKACLCGVLDSNVLLGGEIYSLSYSVRLTAQSLVRSLQDKVAQILYPTDFERKKL